MRCLPFILLIPLLQNHANARTHILEYAPAPPDNPLKGFVPYMGEWNTFPHSMEWFYAPMAEAMKGPAEFDWTALERRLDAIAARGHQAIFRFYLNYPGEPSGVPKYLLDAGLRLREWSNKAAEGKKSRTPDYEDPRLREAMRAFIAALGKRYDGDPRVAFITAGLLGTWGEWHEFPHDDWFASKTVQREVLDAYAAAFRKTQVGIRYPAGPRDYSKCDNSDLPLGYHDDSFCWATRETGRKQDAWFFMPSMQRAGVLDRWKTRFIGGEVRPEIWHTLWNDPTGAPKGQEFGACVDDTHATWLMNHGLFHKTPTGPALDRALAGARKLGYELHIASAEIHWPEIELKIENRGVAPFYYPWKVELAALDSTGAVAAAWDPGWKLPEVLPGTPVAWKFRAQENTLQTGSYRIALRVKNPLPSGKALRFANREQDAGIAGWLTLGSFTR